MPIDDYLVLLVSDDSDGGRLAREAFAACGVPARFAVLRTLAEFIANAHEPASAAGPQLLIIDADSPEPRWQEVVEYLARDLDRRPLVVLLGEPSSVEELDGATRPVARLDKPRDWDGYCALARLAQRLLEACQVFATTAPPGAEKPRAGGQEDWSAMLAAHRDADDAMRTCIASLGTPAFPMALARYQQVMMRACAARVHIGAAQPRPAQPATDPPAGHSEAG